MVKSFPGCACPGVKIMNNDTQVSEVNRRDFLKGGSMASLMTLMGGVLITPERAQAADADAPKKPKNPPIKCGVIGLGPWGREILQSLSRMGNAPVTGVCDTSTAMVNRSKKDAPEAKAYSDYKQLLADKDIKCVLIATPTHTHKQIVLDALAAGKQVWCEAPLAHTIEDARAIAQAAAKNPKSYFQSALQLRSDPELLNIQKFVAAGAMGTPVKARSQFNRKNSWRRPAPNADREKELNWRLDKNLSTGLIGEQGIHQVDQALWFFRKRPISITGFSSTILWNDGREVPDTVQAVLEFPDGVRMTYDASLGTSFDGEYDMFYGSDAAVMLRDRKGWMFRESDAPLLGWEVYARKETFYKESGIVLASNATKLVAQGDTGQKSPLLDFSSLYYALEAFVNNAYLHSGAVEDFIATYGEGDNDALKEYLKEVEAKKMPATDARQGFEATAVVIKANEAIMKKDRLMIDPSIFKI
jgi:predicted dehydrogenase